MALTISNASTLSDDVWGRQKVRTVIVTFDDSYPAGGESFTPADAGLSEFSLVIPVVDAGEAPGFVVQYDYTAQKLLVLGVEQDADAATTEPLDEDDDTEDLATLVIRVLCVGI